MSLSESCSCGASFSADRDDQLRLLNQWRKLHACPKQEGGFLVSSVSTDSETVHDFVYPNLRVGFRGDEDFE